MLMNIKELNNPEISMVNGFHSNGTHCGLKKDNKLDLGLVYSDVKAKTFAVYTKNRVKGAPLIVCKKHLNDNTAQALVVNSKIANTCTGEQGINNSESICKETADILNINAQDVIPMSTGVIGEQLPVDKIFNGLLSLKDIIKDKNDNNFVKAIMTTDTYPKIKGVKVSSSNCEYHIVGCAKGSGMIEPDMATMLAFIFTDCNIADALMENAFKNAVEKSFNSITVDGDMSTNDCAIVFVNGLAGNPEINNAETGEYITFCKALENTTVNLAKEIARDGEGATKFIEINVNKASSKNDAKTVCKSVANSKLVKTALNGEDANWGRILCAMGYSSVDFDPGNVDLTINNIKIFSDGKKTGYSESDISFKLKNKEIIINIDLNTGTESWTVWTCDLSEDYIKINAGYRS